MSSGDGNGHRTRSGSRALKRNSQGETTDTPAPAQSISRSSLWYSRGIVSHEIEFSFLDSSHDTYTCATSVIVGQKATWRRVASYREWRDRRRY